MATNLEIRPPSDARNSAGDLAMWQSHVALGLQTRKNSATESEVLGVSRQLARLADAAAQSQCATALADPLIVFTQALIACSGD